MCPMFSLVWTVWSAANISTFSSSLTAGSGLDHDQLNQNQKSPERATIFTQSQKGNH